MFISIQELVGNQTQFLSVYDPYSNTLLDSNHSSAPAINLLLIPLPTRVMCLNMFTVFPVCQVQHRKTSTLPKVCLEQFRLELLFFRFMISLQPYHIQTYLAFTVMLPPNYIRLFLAGRTQCCPEYLSMFEYGVC